MPMGDWKSKPAVPGRLPMECSLVRLKLSVYDHNDVHGPSTADLSRTRQNSTDHLSQ